MGRPNREDNDVSFWSLELRANVHSSIASIQDPAMAKTLDFDGEPSS